MGGCGVRGQEVLSGCGLCSKSEREPETHNKGTESSHPGDFLLCSLRGRGVRALLLLSGCFCCSLGCSDGCPCCLPLCELGLDKGDEGQGREGTSKRWGSQEWVRAVLREGRLEGVSKEGVKEGSGKKS